MERLTKRNKLKLSHGLEDVICNKTNDTSDCNDSCMRIIPCNWQRKALDKLKEYEDLEEQGLLLRLPCKVGDTVYYIDDYYVYSDKVNSIEIRKENEEYVFTIAYMDYKTEDFGKTVFLTKEEAEAKLKEMESEEHD